MTTNRFDQIIVRNRSRRTRDVGFLLVLSLLTGLAFAATVSAGGSTAAAASVHAAPVVAVQACAATVASC